MIIGLVILTFLFFGFGQIDESVIYNPIGPIEPIEFDKEYLTFDYWIQLISITVIIAILIFVVSRIQEKGEVISNDSEMS